MKSYEKWTVEQPNGYNPSNIDRRTEEELDDCEISDFDRWAIRRRIRQDNRKWLGREIVKFGFFIAALILIFGYFFG